MVLDLPGEIISLYPVFNPWRPPGGQGEDPASNGFLRSDGRNPQWRNSK
jgi:hypothetical protein